jgi:AcrR family transcriptional regulator
LSTAIATRFQPRKTPVQARSVASVDAILEATIQVLLKDGKMNLTTTRVAERAGVSVGTLYQYFPNKSALLQALLRDKLSAVIASVEKVSIDMHGAPLADMAEALVKAFVAAKFKHAGVSVALYAASEDLGGKKIAREMQLRSVTAIQQMIQSSSETISGDPAAIAQTLQGAISGVSRATLENGVNPSAMQSMEQQLIVLTTAYLRASAAVLVSGTSHVQNLSSPPTPLKSPNPL